jgi:hypothetical protein
MAARAAVSYLRRDLRLVYVLFVWAAFATALILFLDGGASFHGGAARPTPAAQAANDDALYTGSVIVVPRTGNDCWKMMLDNRTGRMWEGGYVDCDATVGLLAQGEASTQARAGRLTAIGASFRERR